MDLYAETDIAAIVERVVAGIETFCCLKGRTDIQWVVFALLAEAAFAFFQSGTEEGIAVGSQYYFPGLEVEGDDADVLSVYI